VDAVWLRLLVRLQGGLAARQSLVSEDEALELQGLQNASDQMLEVLTQARMQPLDEVVLKQVITQHLQLVGEIRLLQQQANEAIRPDLEIALNRMRQTLPAAMIPYHVAVGAYNEALSMRPASWLAGRLKFKPAVRIDHGFHLRSAYEPKAPHEQGKTSCTTRNHTIFQPHKS
jgi:LemA protein